MALFVNYMGFGDSILAGSLTLGLLCVPLVIRTTEEALKAIPDTLLEGNINTPEKARHVIELGAYSVVVGSIITRPQLITKSFVEEMER